MTPYTPVFGGPAGDWLAVIGVLSLLYWAGRLLAVLIRYAQTSPVEAPAPAMPPRATPPRATGPAGPADAGSLATDLPVIAAAVAAMFDSHRIVHIERAPGAQIWSAQGRWLHQTSHRTH
ncbi:MAG: hypothetical protein QM753_11465 [Thermomicrobiales bacterium]